VDFNAIYLTSTLPGRKRYLLELVMVLAG